MTEPKINPAKRGRKTDYKPEFAAQTEALCKLGATDVELADNFGVNTLTIQRWRARFPEFCMASRAGKEFADDRVERSLYNRAVGYTFETEKIAINARGKVTRVKTLEHVPPDTNAAFIWLKNRRKGEWRDRHEVEIGGVGDFDRMTNDELAEFIKATVTQTGGSLGGIEESSTTGLVRGSGRPN